MRRSLLLLGMVLISLVGCAASNHTTPLLIKSEVARATPDIPTDVLHAQGAANNAFALDMYRQVSATSKENFLFSPYSIRTAFAMLYAGARGNTEAEIATVLHYDIPQNDLHPALNRLDLNLAATGEGTELTIANGVWVRQDFELLPTYLDILAEQYGTGLYSADFATPAGRTEAVASVNRWVNERTKGEIPELVTSFPDLTALFLANAVYFKGTWETPFNPENTKDASFKTLAGDTVTVPMMHATMTLPYQISARWQALSIPYQDGKTRFVAVLPYAYDAVESQLSLLDLKGIQQRFDLTIEVNLGGSAHKRWVLTHIKCKR